MLTTICFFFGVVMEKFGFLLIQLESHMFYMSFDSGQTLGMISDMRAI